jgi:hypothetical protein
MTESKIIERIERDAQTPGLLTLLAERLTPSDLQSLLLEVYRQRAQRQNPSAVLGEYEKNRFVRPGSVLPARLIEWERVAYATLPSGFQSITLSPVAPLGTSSAIGLVDQNRVLSTIRNSEVVSDSTNVMALEAAVQRRTMLKANPKSKERVHLAASHRLLRTQNYGDPKAASHFAIFSLCSAGQDMGSLEFELSETRTHITFYLRALRAFAGEAVPLRVTMADFGTQKQAVIEQAVFAPLQAEFPYINVEMSAEDEGHDYYAGFRFHILSTNSEGREMHLVDGGPVNWTQKLLSNAKERCVISGIGSERVCMEFGII